MIHLPKRIETQQESESVESKGNSRDFSANIDHNNAKWKAKYKLMYKVLHSFRACFVRSFTCFFLMHSIFWVVRLLVFFFFMHPSSSISTLSYTLIFHNHRPTCCNWFDFKLIMHVEVARARETMSNEQWQHKSGDGDGAKIEISWKCEH